MVLKRTNSQLEEIAHLRNGAGIKQDSFGENGIPIVRVSDFTENSVDISQSIFLRTEELDKWKSFSLEIDEILVATVGSWGTSATSAVGKVVRIPESAVNCIQNQNTCSIKAIKDIASQRWIYYALKHADFKHFVDSAAAGSANQAQLAVKNLSKYPLFVPCLSNQKAIAHILGKLDDKIELNQKMNQTLEEIAKAIFKSWFVDFDPVRAKMEGRPTGLPPEIDELFPDELVDSEIGAIPKRWSVSTLGDLVTPKKGKSITKKKIVEGSVPVVAGGLSPAYYHNTSNVKAPTVTISASGANAGFARLYNEDIWASDCSYISEEQTPFVFLWYVFLKIRQEKIYHMQQGAAQPHIYPSDLMRLQLAYPESDELWRRALDLIAPMFLRIGNADKESVVLSDLRDTLLPKLISGELRIPDAEKFLEEVGI